MSGSETNQSEIFVWLLFAVLRSDRKLRAVSECVCVCVCEEGAEQKGGRKNSWWSSASAVSASEVAR